MTLIDQLIYTVEQRIAAAYVEEKWTEKPVEQNIKPYVFYISQGNNKYSRYSVQTLGEIPYTYNPDRKFLSYYSNNGYCVFFTPEDTIHTAFLKILKSEYENAIINGTVYREGQPNGFTLELDLTGT